MTTQDHREAKTMTEQPYTAEQMLAAIPCLVARDMHMEAAMLRQAAQMMREREPVKVTDEPAAWMRGGVCYREGNGRRDGEKIITEHKVFPTDIPLYTARRAAVPDVTKRVAEHMARSVEYIEKVYPNARQLDAGPIMRNLRRWSRMLAAAIDAAMAKESGNG